MKKQMITIGVLALVLSLCLPAWATRLWIPEPMNLDIGSSTRIDGGVFPTLALVNGVQPVVSNAGFRGTPGPMWGSFMRTPFGWDYAPISAFGCIAGNGERTIVGNNYPVDLAANGKFYSYSPGSGILPLKYSGGSWIPATSTPFTARPTNDQAAVGADAYGNVYLSCENYIVENSGGVWGTPIDLRSGPQTAFGLQRVSDMAVSPVGGEIAISGYDESNQKVVIWFDYKSNWSKRVLGPAWASTDERIAVEWSPDGNLGVAYTKQGNQVWFDYLDMKDGWAPSECAFTDPNSATLTGAALAFDRYNNPVIASGTWLIYDPVVPEPLTMLLLGLGGTALIRRKSA